MVDLTHSLVVDCRQVGQYFVMYMIYLCIFLERLSIQTVSINWLQKCPIRQGLKKKKEFFTKGEGGVSDGLFYNVGL